MVNIYHSRRNNYRQCTYWNRDESTSVGDLTTWILKTTPQGIFYAKETSQNIQSNQVGNVAMYDKNTINLETDDNINDIERGSIVLYNGKTWIVDSIQNKVINKESEYQVDGYRWFITLHR